MIPRRQQRILMKGSGAVAAIALSGMAACQAEPSRSNCPDAAGSRPLPAMSVAGRGHGSTYYVRTDGGDASQCTGRADVAYPGSGTAQNCAWNHPDIALPPSGKPRIVGGDTLLVASGTYLIGDGGHLQPVPSGPSATTPTRLLGKPGAAAPKLVGINGVHRVLNLDGSSNIELGNLEITDQSDCVHNHANASATCTSTMAWARVGLYARASRNVWVHDVDIHGLAARGIQAGGLSDWTVERVKLNRNGHAGWDGNIGSGGSNSGRIILRDIEIGWNGCGERWRTGEAWACWAQSTGGYGDGLGTTDTGGQWLIEDAFIHHNTSDGLDLRYMDGADGTHVTLRRVHARANAGNQVKVKGNALIENSVLVGHCSYFKGRHFMLEGDLCRADGSTLQLVMTGNDTVTVRHNTLSGEGATQIGHSEGNATDRIHLQNNIVVGFPRYRDPSVLSAFNGGGSPAARRFSGNLAWNVESCPTGSTCDRNPKLANMALATFDAQPRADSPVIGSAVALPCDTTDFRRSPRPAGTRADIGAIQVKRP